MIIQAGDYIKHISHLAWGCGVIVETRESILPGGTRLLKVKFSIAGLKIFFIDTADRDFVKLSAKDISTAAARSEIAYKLAGSSPALVGGFEKK